MKKPTKTISKLCAQLDEAEALRADAARLASAATARAAKAERDRDALLAEANSARIYGLKVASGCVMEQAAAEREAARRGLRYCERPEVSRDELREQRVNIQRRLAIADAYDLAAEFLSTRTKDVP